MISNDALVGVITALAIIGSVFILESIAWLVSCFVQAYSTKASTRVAIGADAGFNLQLGTSVWFAWKALTRKTKRGYMPSERVPSQFSGMAFISFVSALCFSLVILLEVGVVYMSKPVTTYRYLSEGGLKVLTVGSKERLDLKLNGVGHIEIGVSSFTDSLSARYTSSAYINIGHFDEGVALQIEDAMQQRQTDISVWTLCTVDGRNADGTIITETNKIRKQANAISFYFFDLDNRPFYVSAERTMATLGTSQTHIFTDLEEADADRIEAELFNGLGFECQTVGTSVQNVTKVKEFNCKALLGIEAPTQNGHALYALVDKVRAEVARRVFHVGDYTVQWKSDIRNGGSEPVEKFDPIFAADTGIDPSSTTFAVLCVAAALGVIRLITGAFIDHRGIAEPFLFRATANGKGWASPGNWDGWDGCKWRVYNCNDANYFGYTNRKWSEDYHTAFEGESAKPVDKDAV